MAASTAASSQIVMLQDLQQDLPIYSMQDLALYPTDTYLEELVEACPMLPKEVPLQPKQIATVIKAFLKFSKKGVKGAKNVCQSINFKEAAQNAGLFMKGLLQGYFNDFNEHFDWAKCVNSSKTIGPLMATMLEGFFKKGEKTWKIAFKGLVEFIKNIKIANEACYVSGTVNSIYKVIQTIEAFASGPLLIAHIAANAEENSDDLAKAALGLTKATLKGNYQKAGKHCGIGLAILLSGGPLLLQLHQAGVINQNQLVELMSMQPVEQLQALTQIQDIQQITQMLAYQPVQMEQSLLMNNQATMLYLI